MSIRPHLTVTNLAGRVFHVRINRAGKLSERGRTVQDRVLVPGDEPSYAPDHDAVEFFDATYAGQPGFHPDLGQFIGAWDVDTTAGRQLGTGWLLDGGVDAWTLNYEAADQVTILARGFQVAS